MHVRAHRHMRVCVRVCARSAVPAPCQHTRRAPTAVRHNSIRWRHVCAPCARRPPPANGAALEQPAHAGTATMLPATRQCTLCALCPSATDIYVYIYTRTHTHIVRVRVRTYVRARPRICRLRLDGAGRQRRGATLAIQMYPRACPTYPPRTRQACGARRKGGTQRTQHGAYQIHTVIPLAVGM